MNLFFFQTVTRTLKNPKFKPAVWSVYERTINDEPRTTNLVEGWHNRFQNIVSKHHPNVYEFIKHLKGEQSHTEKGIERLISGTNAKVVKRKVQSANRRIRNILETFESRSLADFLRGLAMNIKY